MPRVAKPKAGSGGPAIGAPAKKPVGGKNKNKLYVMPEPIPLNTVLADLSKNQWKIGPSIGTGGFGEIYSACKVGEKNFDYVVKCEPHGNGPLFVEMHFYMRNAKLEDIQRFKKEHGIKTLGMPYMLGNGSHELNGQKHRFIVMPRYGNDIARFLLNNGHQLPEVTIYRLALQMIDVYNFVHSCGYVHADLKGANILLGYGKTGAAQAYLVDYGLASHYTTKEFKPDPKKMHNGTIEYTSRDAHQGVATMRADMEILGYNLIEWSGVQLPWVRDNLLSSPIKVQQAKEAFMDDLSGNLKKLYPKGVPVPIAEFMKYVACMKYNEAPDYERCRNIFTTALKIMKCTNSGDLEFKLKAAANNNVSVSKAGSKGKAKLAKTVSPIDVVSFSDEDDVAEICASDDDSSDVFFEPTNRKRAVATKRTLKTAQKKYSPSKHVVHENSPSPSKKQNTLTSKISIKGKNTPTSSPPKIRRHNDVSNNHSPTPPKRKYIDNKKSPTPTKRKNVDNKNSPSPPKRKHSDNKSSPTPINHKHLHKTNKAKDTPSPASRAKLRSTPLGSTTNINFSPSISVSSSTKSSKPGKTIINDHLTPNAKAGKTYEFNFELDVSMDANVVVNVKRKKKPLQTTESAAKRTPTRVAASSNGSMQVGSEESPATRVKVRKLDSGTSNSPLHTPCVTVKKSKKFVRSPC